MAKYFCPKCFELTFSLRYLKSLKWWKPKKDPQYCEKCNKIFSRSECINGLKDLERKKGGENN